MNIARTCAGLLATVALAGGTTAGHASPVASTITLTCIVP
jgi:hypothetical protein